jgi:hypothetical protein
MNDVFIKSKIISMIAMDTKHLAGPMVTLFILWDVSGSSDHT